MTIRRTFAALLLGAVSALAIAEPSQAADAVSAQPTGFNWNGAYLGFGGGIGAVARGTEFLDRPGPAPTAVPGVPTIGLIDIGADGVFAEVTAGYDRMVSERLLLGAFVDARISNIASTIEADGEKLSLKNKYGFDIAARAGYLLTPTTLGYVLGGYSWQKMKLDLPVDVPFETERNRSGYLLGIGMETAISGNWTLKSEYRYADYGNKAVIEDFYLEPTSHTFHVGANYRFGASNGGGADFAMPTYNWTGFYVGGALGAGAIADKLDLEGMVTMAGLGGQGLLGELSVGYDREFNGMWVAGLQLGARYSGMTTSIIDSPELNYEAKADYGFDVLARVGAKVNEATLAYALAGYSWQHVTEKLSDVDSSYKTDWGMNGFSVGGGLETAVTDKMAVNLEYRYSKFEGKGYEDGMLELTPAFHTVRLGAKYKLN